MALEGVVFVTKVSIEQGEYTNQCPTMVNLSTVNMVYEETVKYNTNKAPYDKVLTYSIIVTNNSSFKVKELTKDFLPETLADKFTAFKVQKKLLEVK